LVDSFKSALEWNASEEMTNCPRYRKLVGKSSFFALELAKESNRRLKSKKRSFIPELSRLYLGNWGRGELE
jgi:hypothetical protein